MDLRLANQRLSELLKLLESTSPRWGWRSLVQGSAMSPTVVQQVSRVIALAGESAILYASGGITNAAGAPNTRIVAITDHLVIVAEFGRTGKQLDTSVRGLPYRGRITAIELEDVTPLPPDNGVDGPWPEHAIVIIRLGDEVIRLPVTAAADAPTPAALEAVRAMMM